MAKRVLYGENSDGKLFRHTRTPSPDECLERLEQQTSRERGILDYVRRLPSTVSGPPVAPTDPHASWGTTAYLFNVNTAVVPHMIDLKAPRVGRAFRWHSGTRASDPTFDVALFPACKENPLVPPYPGIPPDDIYNPCSPMSCFSDGKLAKWDPRSHVQLYSERRPWVPYHWGPFLIPPQRHYDLPAESFLHWTSGDFLLVEYLPATAFYQWYWPGKPWRGGFFIRHLLDQLFVRRLSAERHVLRNLHMRENAGMPPLKRSLYDLPWYDDLERVDTLKWASWGEGRDAIGRTCLYVAELGAFAEWIEGQTKRYSIPSRVNSPAADYERYMGTWCNTIPCREEWEVLHRNRVPVYVASTIPAGHHLGADLQAGDLDADEKYRDNSYDAIHRFSNARCPIMREYMFTNLERLCSEYTEDFLPLQLFPPTPLQKVIDDPALSTSWRKSWTSYIYLDPNVARVYDNNLVRFVQWTDDEQFRVESQLLAPFLPPGGYVLTTEESLHPFFLVCPQAKSRTIARYREMYDSSSDTWWFETVKGRWPIEAAKNMAYMFSYPANTVVIYSEHHFPGMNALFCRVSKQPPQTIVPSGRSRRYYYSRPSSNQGSEATCYLWEYKKEYIGEDGIIHHGDGPEECEVGDTPLPNSFDADGYEDLEFAHNSTAQSGSSNTIKKLQEQRSDLRIEVQRRLFNPIKGGDLLCTEVTPWMIPGSQSAPVWPIRIANLHGDVNPAAVIDMLVKTCRIRLVDILIICRYHEIDTTQTIDVALRYSEDALWTWCLLYGVQVDERYLEVCPIRGMRGKGQVLDTSNWTHRNPDDRVHRWSQLSLCSDAYPHPSDVLEEQVARLGITALMHGGTDHDIEGNYDDFVACLPSLLGVQASALNIQKADAQLTTSMAAANVKADLYDALDGALAWPATSPQRAPSASGLNPTPPSRLGPSTSQQRRDGYPSLSSSSRNSQTLDPHDRCLDSRRPFDHRDDRMYINDRDDDNDWQFDNRRYDDNRYFDGHDDRRYNDDRYDNRRLDRRYEDDRYFDNSRHHAATERRQRYGDSRYESTRAVLPDRKKKRHHHQVKRARDGADPAVQQGLSSSERRSRIETLKYKAETLRKSCQLPLPQFALAHSNLTGVDHTVELFTAWWDWLDECHTTLDAIRSQGSHDFDWGTMDDAFGHLQKLKGLYGQEYKRCFSALQKRPRWTPCLPPSE